LLSKLTKFPRKAEKREREREREREMHPDLRARVALSDVLNARTSLAPLIVDLVHRM
jgi:hypothetical protein